MKTTTFFRTFIQNSIKISQRANRISSAFMYFLKKTKQITREVIPRWCFDSTAPAFLWYFSSIRQSRAPTTMFAFLPMIDCECTPVVWFKKLGFLLSFYSLCAWSSCCFNSIHVIGRCSCKVAHICFFSSIADDQWCSDAPFVGWRCVCASCCSLPAESVIGHCQHTRNPCYSPHFFTIFSTRDTCGIWEHLRDSWWRPSPCGLDTSVSSETVEFASEGGGERDLWTSMCVSMVPCPENECLAFNLAQAGPWHNLTRSSPETERWHRWLERSVQPRVDRKWGHFSGLKNKKLEISWNETK